MFRDVNLTFGKIKKSLEKSLEKIRWKEKEFIPFLSVLEPREIYEDVTFYLTSNQEKHTPSQTHQLQYLLIEIDILKK